MSTPLTHRVDGSGPALALLNGGMMSIAAWDPVASLLTPTHRVLRFDFRGQLLSPGPANTTLARHADDVVALLDHLGIDEAHLVGASFGAEVALIVAARHPGRVRSLTCITATDRLTDAMRWDTRELRDAADAAARGGDGSRVFEILYPVTFSEAWLLANRETLASRVLQYRLLPRAFFDGLVGLLDALLTLDLTGELQRITSPALVIGAELDRIFPPAHSEALARAITGARLEIVPAAGHGAIVEATERIIGLVTDFVEAVERGSSRAGARGER